MINPTNLMPTYDSPAIDSPPEDPPEEDLGPQEPITIAPAWLYDFQIVVILESGRVFFVQYGPKSWSEVKALVAAERKHYSASEKVRAVYAETTKDLHFLFGVDGNGNERGNGWEGFSP